jgi:hypothetical protein
LVFRVPHFGQGQVSMVCQGSSADRFWQPIL